MNTDEAQKEIAALLKMDGYHSIYFAADGSEFQVTVAQDDTEGVSGTFVLVVYPFQEDAYTVLDEHRVSVPPSWEVRDFEIEELVEYTVTGSSAESIAQFVNDVFSNLLREEPVLHGLQH